jgi:hypothetical protein
VTDQPSLPFEEDPGDDPLDDLQRPRIAAPLARLKQQVRQRELDGAREREVDVTVELDDGSFRLLSTLTPAEEARVVAIRPDLAGPWEAEDLDDGPPF